MNKCKLLIDATEFQQMVLDYINSEEIDEMISTTVFKDNPEFKRAIIHGMSIASVLTSRCESFYAVEIENGDEK